jgi:hypothetical protein
VPTITHVFNFGLPMKAEDYTHRIGRTGRAGRDGLAVTLAEFRDRRRIFDIEAFTRQQFKSEVIPGMEPQQRAPSARPAGNFGDRGGRDYSRDRKPGGNRGGFGGGFGRNEGFGGNGGGFGDRNARGPRIGGGSYHQGGANTGNGGGNFAPRDDRGGFDRRDGFQDRQPSFGKPSFAKPAGKVFVPRDAKKRPYNPAR